MIEIKIFDQGDVYYSPHTIIFIDNFNNIAGFLKAFDNRKILEMHGETNYNFIRGRTDIPHLFNWEK